MASQYSLGPAKPSDAEQIASLFALSWTSPFTKLQFGEVDIDDLTKNMAPRIKESMMKPQSAYVVLRDTNSRVTSVAQWSLPPEDDSPEQTAEEEKAEDEAYRAKLPQGFNVPLIMDFKVQLRDLRKKVIKGRKHFRR